MTGLYFPLRFLFIGPPEYEFAIVLPGDLIETNGTAPRPVGLDGNSPVPDCSRADTR